MAPPRPAPAGVFRVRVVMERLFSDERARVLVCVSAARRVRWLERRLRAAFALPPRVLLSCGGHLLPPREPLAVLRPDDTVHVLPAEPEPRLPDLARAKQSALQGLERLCAAPPDAPAAAPADERRATRARRRVRRRRAAPAPSPEAPAPSPVAPAPSPGGRPRLVRALSEDAS